MKTIQIILAVLILTSCESNIKTELIGKWQAKNIEVSKAGEFDETFPVEDYGFGSISIENDSIIHINVALLKDLSITKDLPGGKISIPLIKAKYQSYRRGNIRKVGKQFIVSDSKENSTETNIYFKEEFMVSEYYDSDSVRWQMFWLPE